MDSQSSGTTISPSTYSDSSKTGSSRSVTSAGKNREEDLTKDNASTPIDLEGHIQAERIEKLLNATIYKTKLSICLPRLVQEHRTIQSVMKPHHLNDLLEIFDQYDNPLFFGESLLNMSAIDAIKGKDVSLESRLNPELGHLLYILNSYPQLRDTVENIIDEMRINYKNGSRKSEPSIEYLEELEHFRNLMIRQINTSAADVLAVKIKTRKVEGSNAKLIEDIEALKTTLKEENKRFEENMSSKVDLIAKLKQQVAVYNFEESIKRKKTILDSDRQMVLATRAHAIKYEMLREEQSDTMAGYENMLGRHLKEEKNQRLRRCKVETQLQSWLQKYDIEMADKQVEFDGYDDKYKDEFEKVENLEEKLEEQDKEFIPLMEEREKEYHVEMEQKMKTFLLEHAARVIQVAWREVKYNRTEKKRLRKLQVKMQEAKALAERKAAAAAAAAQRAAAIAARQAKKDAKQAAKAAKAAAKEKAAREEAAREAAAKEKAAKEKAERLAVKALIKK